MTRKLATEILIETSQGKNKRVTILTKHIKKRYCKGIENEYIHRKWI